MVTAYDVEGGALVKAISEAIGDKFKQPDWAKFIKTGVHKSRPPETNDWWALRVSSVLRKVYTDGPVGVQRLRSWYGGRQVRGHKPCKTAKAGGKIIRVALKQLEEQKLVKTSKTGRELTSEGRKLLDNLAKKVKDANK